MTKPTMTFSTGDRTAPSGVRVRWVDVSLPGVAGEDLLNVVYAALSPSFDLDVCGPDTLRVSWSDSRLLSTDDITRLIPNIVRAAYAAGLLTPRQSQRTLDAI